jgi:hypothetical protein
MSSDYLEVFKQMSFLSSVLAGFAITAAIQLITFTKKTAIITATTTVFIVSSIVSVMATTLFVFVMTAIIGTPGFPQPSEMWIIHFTGGIGVLPILGLLLFLAGIGLVGWLRSKLLGILTTVFGILASAVIFYVMWSMGSS